MLVPAPALLRRALTASAVGALLTTTPARACLLDPAEVTALARASAAAVLADDVDGHARAWQAFVDGVACLEGPVPTEAWGVLVFDHAIVADADGRDPAPLLAALHGADPALLDRLRADTGRAHLRTWQPDRVPAAPPPARPEEVWVDGRPWAAGRALLGPHVVQRHDRVGWHTAWVEDGAVPDWWTRSASPPRPVVRAVLGAGAATQLFTPLAAQHQVEPAHKVAARVEAGVHVDLGHAWVRATGAVAFQPAGAWLYVGDAGVRATRWAGDGRIAAGGTIGHATLGAALGWAQPARVVGRVLAGWVPDEAARVELAAGVNLLTDLVVEPAGELSVVYTPRLSRRR